MSSADSVPTEMPVVEVAVEPLAQPKPTAASHVDQLLDARRQPSDADLQSPFAVRDRDCVVTTSAGQQVVLRHLTPNERSRFRHQLNLVAGGCGVLLLVIVLLVLLSVG